MSPEPTLLWFAVAAYLAAGSLAIVTLTLGTRAERTVLALILVGLALHALAIGLRWQRLGHGPFVSLFEILSSNTWSLTLVFALAYWRIPPIRPVAAVVMPIVFMMMGWMLIANPADTHLPATFRTPWLYLHVGIGKVFLGALLVAVGLAGAILLRAAGFGIAGLARLPETRRLDDLAYRFMALSLIFDTLMIVTGAIWAQEAWGRYWAWDALETRSLLTWILLGTAIHARFTFRLSPTVGAVQVLVVFALAFLTFFGLPFVSRAAHQGLV